MIVAVEFCADRRHSLPMRALYFPEGLAKERGGVCGVSFVSHRYGIRREGKIFQLGFGNSSRSVSLPEALNYVLGEE